MTVFWVLSRQKWTAMVQKLCTICTGPNWIRISRIDEQWLRTGPEQNREQDRLELLF